MFSTPTCSVEQYVCHDVWPPRGRFPGLNINQEMINIVRTTLFRSRGTSITQVKTINDVSILGRIIIIKKRKLVLNRPIYANFDMTKKTNTPHVV